MTMGDDGRHSLDPLRLAAERAHYVERLSAALPTVMARSPTIRAAAAEDLRVERAEAETIGWACLALRAEAVRDGGEKGYARIYESRSREAGLAVIGHRVRRRLMYFPILAGDDTLAVIVEEQRRYERGSPYFSVVTVAERLKTAFEFGRHIDWLPWGGYAPWDARSRQPGFDGG